MPRTTASYQKLRLPQLDNVELLSTVGYQAAFPAHTHDTFCLSLIEQGTFGENDLLAAPGSLCLTNPGQVHTNPLVQAPGCSFRTFYLSPDVLRALNRQQPVWFATPVVADDSLFRALLQLATSAAQPAPSPQVAVALLGQLGELVRQHASSAAPTPPAEAATVLEIKHFIRESLPQKIALPTLARMAGMDKFAFLRFFKRHTGLTPLAYVLLQRVEQSKRALRAGTPLLDAALDAGFYDQSHHITYFRHFVGVTPATYQAGCNILQS